MSAPVESEPRPPAAEDSEALSETASKLERLRELTHKYSASEGSKMEEVTENEQALETHEVVELQAFVRHKEWIEEKIKVDISSSRFLSFHSYPFHPIPGDPPPHRHICGRGRASQDLRPNYHVDNTCTTRGMGYRT